MRRRHRSPPLGVGLYEAAYRWQQGEFYPEHHCANVVRLHERFPEVPMAEVDAIYRQACRIDAEVADQVGTSELTAAAKEDLVDWLAGHFHGFGRGVFIDAIERREGPKQSG